MDQPSQRRRPGRPGGAIAPAKELPWQTAAEVVEELVALSRAHPGWGPKKLLDVMGCRDSDGHLPLISTAAKLVADAGLVDCIPAVTDEDYDPLREIQEHIADVGPTGVLPASA